MKISIIGSGNVATVLGRLLKQNGYNIEEISSRNKTHANHLAAELHTSSTDISNLKKESDVYIIAVSDDAIKSICKQINVDHKIVVHTCGSVSINTLKNISPNYGVLYPLQSLRKEISYNPVIPFLVDANNKQTRSIITKLAASISNNVIQASDEQRMQYHLSAVITSNFSNHLFALTKAYCESNNIDFSVLLPVIEETVKRMRKYDPSKMQTGPAIRNDQSTIKKHLTLLSNFPQLKNLYEIMSNSIIQSNRK